MSDLEKPLVEHRGTLTRADTEERRENKMKVVIETTKLEESKINELRAQRENAGFDDGETFAVAFSGGGIRAAAFQCGVLWKLAEMGKLKDVTYLSAVSGGGYIAMGFAAHCLAAYREKKPARHEVDDWYKDVVAKTVVRMQNNAGDFVRDFVRSGPGKPSDGSGCTSLPRVLDAPILFFTLILTLMVNPIFIFLCFMLPTALVTNAWFGDEMRSLFCDIHGPEKLSTFKFGTFSIGCVSSAAFTFLIWVLMHIAPFKDPHTGAKINDRVHPRKWFLIAHGLYAFFVRFSAVCWTLLAFLHATLVVQVLLFTQQRDDSRFYQKYCNAGVQGHCLEDGGCLPSLESHILLIVGLLFLASVVIMPWSGNSVTVFLACVFGPLLIFIFEMRLTQFVVFGPITGQDFFTGFGYNSNWYYIIGSVLFLNLLILPFYPEIRAILHTYYMRCLAGNFFPDGKDGNIVDLLECPYIPLILVTATSSDFRSPIGGDRDNLSEVSMTPLHVGSIETGFVPMHPERTMGKCTALTAAGCVDACALTLSSLLTMRFWLEILNLSWGDYVSFTSDERKTRGCCDFAGEWDSRFIQRMPADFSVWICFVLVFAGFVMDNLMCLKIAIGLFCFIMTLSFLCFKPLEKIFAVSPFIRQIHQGSMFCFRGETPPPMLYMTDGGCRDCTTINQLLMRRQPRILLVLAASDPHDELGVLRTAITMAKDGGYATFYNTVDPRKDIDDIFANFKADSSIRFMTLGVTYPPALRSSNEYGRLVIVKNRMYDGFENLPIEPHLSEAEMGSGSSVSRAMEEGMRAFNEDDWKGLSNDKLGPFCCCDCTHLNPVTNSGPKFPHGNFVNFLYMTPMWCNMLARLAHGVSADAINDVSRKGSLQAAWEKEVAAQ
eukprot:CAMPEP_0194493852 /NCGR_PEP_ID=MMETSP0253-20130528/11940_1 /TAXON_ID=2966 /ORGANISM="Noctiluca scintillans" /LENGTH=886 /DNA_ID=CAMNT_0039334887 /DNA_START=68 /DNA_END=2728 /DNA_ORIENTATION=-